MSVLRVDGVVFEAALIIYNLDLLLGPAHVDELRRHSALFKSGSLFLLGRRRTMELQGRLWKLHGYMSRAGDDGM